MSMASISELIKLHAAGRFPIERLITTFPLSTNQRGD